MSGGFRVFLALIAVVVLAYTIMSVLPILTSPLPSGSTGFSSRSQNTGTAGITVKPDSQLTAQQLAMTQGTQNQAPLQVSTVTSASMPPVDLNLRAERDAETTQGDWVFAKRSFYLLTAPNGNAHRALSLTNADLEIMTGTRLRKVRPENEWVLVKSPGNILGWVHERDLTVQPPGETEHHWVLRPAES